MSFFARIERSISSSPTKQKIFRNLFWALCGKIVNLLGSLLVGIIVARYLGPEKYGLMNYVMSIVLMFQVFAGFGLDAIEIREEAKSPADRDTLIGTAFVLRLFFAVITLVTLLAGVWVFEEDAYVVRLVMIYSLSIILSAFNVARNHFTSLVWNEYVVKTEISRTIVGLFVKVTLLLCHASLTWFVASLTFDCVLLASGYVLSYRRKIGSVRLWRYDGRQARYYVRQSFPLLLSGAAIVIYQRIDQVMLGNMLDKGSVGIYSVAVRFVEILIFVPTIISQTVSPLLVKLLQVDKVQYQQRAHLFMNVTLWLSVALALFLSFCSYPLVYITFGEQFLPSVAILSVMSFKVIGVALSQTSGQLIVVEGRQKWVSVRNVVGCGVCVILNYLLISRYGVMGAAYVSIITILCSGFLVNSVIPAYRGIFKMQVSSILTGWKDLVHIKQLLR